MTYFTDYAAKDRRLIFTERRRLKLYPWLVIGAMVLIGFILK